MGSLIASGRGWVPEQIVLPRTLATMDMATVLEELDGLDPGLLAAEVEFRLGGDALPPAWRALVERPAAFVDSYRRLLKAAWECVAPWWSLTDDLYGREMERIGVAAVAGGLETVMNDLSTSVRFDDGLLRLARCPHRRPAGSGWRRLVLVPLASGFSAGMYSVERDDAIWIGYPLPGLGRIVERQEDPAPVPDDALALVLGPVRAAILRHAGDRPSVSDLASRLAVGVSTVTYHCDHLVTAGLLRRERRGREVRLRRTDLGTSLLDLLAR
ncbi:hypothetical protein AB0C21_09045 [Spirillospora sp. NPDC049024]